MSKIKVAFCLKGAIGYANKDYTSRDAMYTQTDNYVNYTQCYNSIIRHIVTPNNTTHTIDFFIHCWTVDLEDELVSLYKPKARLFEDNRQCADIINKSCTQPGEYSGVSQALAIKKTIELKEDYEKQNNTTYDLVIVYRPDILLWKDMDLTTYTNLEETIYVNAHDDSNGDFHFVMSNQLSAEFKKLFDSLTNNNPHQTHYYIKNYVTKFMNKNLQKDAIIPGTYQEVLRKISSCLGRSISQEILDSYLQQTTSLL